MKRPIFTLLIFTGLLLAIFLWPSRKSQLIALTHDGDAACQQCVNTAYQDWQQCVAIINDEGDADCRIQYNNAISYCQQTACIMAAENKLTTGGSSPVLAFTTLSLVPFTPTAEAAGACESGGLYYETCSDVGLTVWDTCRAAGGSKPECESAAQVAQNNCMRDFGCPPIIF